jgi:hypothetical protein
MLLSIYNNSKIFFPIHYFLNILFFKQKSFYDETEELIYFDAKFVINYYLKFLFIFLWKIIIHIYLNLIKTIKLTGFNYDFVDRKIKMI